MKRGGCKVYKSGAGRVFMQVSLSVKWDKDSVVLPRFGKSSG